MLRTTEYGETHKILTIYMKETGKVGVVARGAKKTQSRLSSVSQWFTYGRYLYVKGKGAGLGTLRQGEIVDSFRTIQTDLTRTAYAAYIVELLDKLTSDGQPDRYLFELLYQTLHHIDDGRDPEVLAMVFAVKMWPVAGILPQLQYCVKCGIEEGPYVFSVREGGVLCPRCQKKEPHHSPSSPRVPLLFKRFLDANLARVGTVSLKEETKRELRNVISEYEEQYGGFRLKSKKFLEKLYLFNNNKS